MGALRKFAAFVDGLNRQTGNLMAWIVWLIAIVCAIVVGYRYILHMTFTWMQELYVWIHAVVFLAAASYAMLVNAHVRVDILYTKWSPKTRAAVEIAGALAFTVPWVTVLAWLTWPFVSDSWAIRETSAQPNGMSGMYLFKTMLLVFCGLMLLQCLAVIARGVLVLCGDRDAAATPPFGGPGHADQPAP